MKNAVGIVCEFNPFHNGHAYLLRRVRECFPDRGIVCVMSGNFVQRGSFSVQEKYSRARCATLAGADLVLEIPYPFSCLSAESFADAAIGILSSLGVCDTLAFGTEIDDAEALSLCAERLSSDAFGDVLASYMKENRGVGFPAARERVYTEHYGATPILSCPNASLAVSYLLAARARNAAFRMAPFARIGHGFDSLSEEGDYLSATALRAMIAKGSSLSGHVPAETQAEILREKAAGRFPVDMETMKDVLFYLIRMKDRESLSRIYGFSALSARARRFLPESDSIAELVEQMKNATFTDSRIRRALLALLLDLPRYAEKETVLYTTVLSIGKNGRSLLSEIKERSDFPVFTKPAHGLKSEDPKLHRAFSRAALADEIYASAFPKKQGEGYFIKKNPFILP